MHCWSNVHLLAGRTHSTPSHRVHCQMIPRYNGSYIMVTLYRSLNKFWNLMYAKTSWPKAWADGDPRWSISDSSSWRYSFILGGGIIGKARSIQTNPEFTKWQGLQTEGVSITFKYLALRPLAIIEPSKSLLRDLLPHVLKMEVHYWYKLFVHCVENYFESTISWGSLLHLSTKSILFLYILCGK